MEWTGAGALFVSQMRGQEMMLLGRETRDGCWGDIGGLKMPQEGAIATAARRISQETGGAFGTVEAIRQLLHSTSERIPVGTYRMLICPLKESEFSKGIPGRLHCAPDPDEGRRSLERLTWIATEKVYRAMVDSIINNRYTVSVWGRVLRPRLVEALKQSTGFQAYLKKHTDIPARPLDITRLRSVRTTLRDPEDPKKGVVPLVTLNDIDGKPNKVFAIVQRGSSYKDLVAEDRSFYRTDLMKSSFERFTHFCRRTLRIQPSLASNAERLLIFQGIQGEGVPTRIERLYLNLRCWFGQTPRSILQPATGEIDDA